MLNHIKTACALTQDPIIVTRGRDIWVVGILTGEKSPLAYFGHVRGHEDRPEAAYAVPEELPNKGRLQLTGPLIHNSTRAWSEPLEGLSEGPVPYLELIAVRDNLPGVIALESSAKQLKRSLTSSAPKGHAARFRLAPDELRIVEFVDKTDDTRTTVEDRQVEGIIFPVRPFTPLLIDVDVMYLGDAFSLMPIDRLLLNTKDPNLPLVLVGSGGNDAWVLLAPMRF